MVIPVRCDDWEIRIVFVGQGSSTYYPILGCTRETSPHSKGPKSFQGVISWVLRGVGASERIHNIEDHLWIGGTSQPNSGHVSCYRHPSSYKVIIGQPTYNQLGAT